MCGLAGLSFKQPHPDAPAVVREMVERIAHRGPDAAGYHHDPPHTYLGFCRLAVRDPHQRANQPMRSQSGRTWIVFNGEIYNSREIAQRYGSDLTWRTSGDTEVLLEAFERQGNSVFHDLRGMYAVALYDAVGQRLILARDPVGKKPLFLYETADYIAFASELGALEPLGLQPEARHLPLFFHYGYFPGRTTFYRNVTQVEPGQVVTIRQGRIVRRSHFFRWKDLPWGTENQVDSAHLTDLIRQAVGRRLVADRPVGAFLSSGVDSTLIAATLRDLTQPRPTFTVAFEQSQYDEAPLAAQTARQLGLPHVVLPCPATGVAELAEQFLATYRQPLADTSGLATILLCQAARSRVTVALAGDGGDEFFGGYRRYVWLDRCWRARRASFGTGHWLVRMAGWRRPHHAARVARWLQADDPAGMYAEVIRAWYACPIEQLVRADSRHTDDPAMLVRDLFRAVPSDMLSQAACFDATYYLPGALQVKLDRASMRVALEVRCPLLDLEVARYGAALSSRVKFHPRPKSVLRSLLAQHTGTATAGRPKRGFSVPLAAWLAGPLHDWASDTLAARRWREWGWVDAQQGDRVWHAFRQGQHHLASQVWMLLSVAQCVTRSGSAGRNHSMHPAA